MTNTIVSLLQALFSLVENHIDLTGDTSRFEVYDENNNVIGYKGTLTHSSEGILAGIRVITPKNFNDKVIATADVAVTDTETGSILKLHVTAHASLSESSDSTFVIDDAYGDTIYNDAHIIKALMSIINWTYENEWYNDNSVYTSFSSPHDGSYHTDNHDDAESIASAIADAANEVE